VFPYTVIQSAFITVQIISFCVVTHSRMHQFPLGLIFPLRLRLLFSLLEYVVSLASLFLDNRRLYQTQQQLFLTPETLRP
jgi:hypothetical protein